MTSEEFVFWLSGYVSAIDERVKVPNERDWDRIKSALSHVNAGSIIYGIKLEPHE